MRCEVIHLNERFPILGEAGKDPLLAVYLPTPMPDDNLRNEKRPCVLICPGGHHGLSTADNLTNAKLGAVLLRAHDWLRQVKIWLNDSL